MVSIVCELIIVHPLSILFLPERTEKTPRQKTWELTTPLPLNEDGSSVSAILGSNPEVHYIYVCIKVRCLYQVHYPSPSYIYFLFVFLCGFNWAFFTGRMPTNKSKYRQILEVMIMDLVLPATLE